MILANIGLREVNIATDGRDLLHQLNILPACGEVLVIPST